MDCSRHPLPFLCASVSLWLAFLSGAFGTDEPRV
jgi:hypothetical protein